MKLLIISYHFPPGGGVSVQRVLSFAKYLPKNGFSVHVLTAWNGAYPLYDSSLLNEVPTDVQIIRAFTPEIPYSLRKQAWALATRKRNAGTKTAAARRRDHDRIGGLLGYIQDLFCPDPQVVWTPFAIRRAKALIRNYGIDVVMITAPPFSSFLIGNELKREFPRITLVSDFRDEWLQYYLGNVQRLGGEQIRQRAEVIEKNTVAASDMVIATTESTLRRMRTRYPEQPALKFVHIPNGYDPDRLTTFEPSETSNRSSLVIGYLGTVYGPCSPRRYLEAIDSLPAEIRDRIETRFIGRVTEEQRGFLEQASSRLVMSGFLPQKRAFQELRKSDWLLLIVDDEVSIAGKTFEYLAMGKPILALAPPESETALLLRRTGGAICVDSRNTTCIRQAILYIFERFKWGKVPERASRLEVAKYERQKIVAQLARLIHAMRSTGLREAAQL